jgi:hypothetical protein
MEGGRTSGDYNGEGMDKNSCHGLSMPFLDMMIHDGVENG